MHITLGRSSTPFANVLAVKLSKTPFPGQQNALLVVGTHCLIGLQYLYLWTFDSLRLGLWQFAGIKVGNKPLTGTSSKKRSTLMAALRAYSRPGGAARRRTIAPG